MLDGYAGYSCLQFFMFLSSFGTPSLPFWFGVLSSRKWPPGAGIEPRECACIICLDSDPPPIQSGCACRSDTGVAHVGCLIEKAVAQQPHRGNKVWWECQTCGQEFTGAMQTGLAAAWWSRVCEEAEESAERLCAATNLANARGSDGQYVEAERIIRETCAWCKEAGTRR